MKQPKKIVWSLLVQELVAKGYTAAKTDDGYSFANDYIDINTEDKWLIISCPTKKHFKPAKLRLEHLDTAKVLRFAEIYSAFIQTADMSHTKARQA